MTILGKRDRTLKPRPDNFNIDGLPAYGAARVLIAADDSLTLQLLGSSIDGWGYETMVVFNDRELVHRMKHQARPPLVIVDGQMQETDGLALCRRIRLSFQIPRPYIVLVTSAGSVEAALFDPSTGPDDVLMRPFTTSELHARIHAGMRIMELETELSRLSVDLRSATNKIVKLSGLLPICSHCKKIRDDSGYWNELEKYISDHSDAEFSHAICPTCLHEYYPDVKDECL